MEVYQKFILNNKVIAENKLILNKYDNRLPLFNYSIANFCPDCGEVWSRIARNNLSWWIRTINCIKCESTKSTKSLYPIAGSFFDPIEHIRQIESWPDEIIIYEYNLLLDLAEHKLKENKDWNGTIE